MYDHKVMELDTPTDKEFEEVLDTASRNGWELHHTVMAMDSDLARFYTLVFRRRLGYALERTSRGRGLVDVQGS